MSGGVSKMIARRVRNIQLRPLRMVAYLSLLSPSLLLLACQCSKVGISHNSSNSSPHSDHHSFHIHSSPLKAVHNEAKNTRQLHKLQAQGHLTTLCLECESLLYLLPSA